MNEIRAFVNAHKWTVSCVALGLLCAVLLLTIGFWRTLLLYLVVGCSFALGRELDKRGSGRIKSLLQKVFSKENNA